jgi:hypothetical protein
MCIYVWQEINILAFESSSPGVLTVVVLKTTSSLVLAEGVKPLGVTAFPFPFPFPFPPPFPPLGADDDEAAGAFDDVADADSCAKAQPANAATKSDVEIYMILV